MKDLFKGSKKTRLSFSAIGFKYFYQRAGVLTRSNQPNPHHHKAGRFTRHQQNDFEK